MKLRSILILSSVVALSTCAELQSNSDHSKLHTPSNIRGPKYSALIAESKSIAEKKYIQYIEYGSSVKGQPLHALKFKSSTFELPSDSNAKRRAVLLTDAIHGDEYLGVVRHMAQVLSIAKDIPKHIKTFLVQGGIIYLVPVMNPDAYSARRRENANNKDVNRDYPDSVIERHAFLQPESRSLDVFLKQDLNKEKARLAFNIDYHCCEGSILYPYRGDSGREVRALDEKHKNGFLTLGRIVKDLFGYRYGSIAELVAYDAIGGSADYYFDTYGSYAFGFEGLDHSEAKKYDLHTKMLDQFFQRFLKKPNPTAKPS